MLEFVINNYWRDVSNRSLLYYLYLLELETSGTPEDELSSNREALSTMVSIQTGEFDSTVKEFFEAGIISDAETCRLAREAIYPIERLFDKTFGRHDPELLRYNGLRIYKASEAERNRLWVEKVSHDLDLSFGKIAGMHIKIRDDLDVRRTKRLVTLETGGGTPFMSWGLLGNPRMTRMSEILELVDHENSMIQERVQHTLRKRLGYTLEGVNAVSIVAAPTYDEAIAHQLRHDHRRIIGPINLEGLLYYLELRQIKITTENKKEHEDLKQRNVEVREHQYQALLQALRRFNGVAPVGVIDCILLGDYLDLRLKDLYATYNITVNGKAG
jgi:hypothetical protein